MTENIVIINGKKYDIDDKKDNKSLLDTLKNQDIKKFMTLSFTLYEYLFDLKEDNVRVQKYLRDDFKNKLPLLYRSYVEVLNSTNLDSQDTDNQFLVVFNSFKDLLDNPQKFNVDTLDKLNKKILTLFEIIPFLLNKSNRNYQQ